MYFSMLCTLYPSVPQDVTPPRSVGGSLSDGSDGAASVETTASHRRRRRVAYTAAEERHLVEGVRRTGRRWIDILSDYEFHESRTAVDLKEKYQRMMVGGSTTDTGKMRSDETYFENCIPRA